MSSTATPAEDPRVPVFMRAARRAAENSTAYRRAVAAGEINTAGEPVDQTTREPRPLYDGHGRIIGVTP